MGKSRKGNLVVRQRVALQRLEAAYEEFKVAGEDKAPRTSSRDGGKRLIHKKGRTFNEECKRMRNEISILKEKISKSHI